MKRIYTLLFALALFACAQAGELADLHQKFAPPSTTATNGETGFAGKSLGYSGDITSIGIERTRCYAGCSAYTFIVQQDGTFRYEGSYGVERMGAYTGTVSVGRLNQVFAFLEETDYQVFDSSYRAQFLDGPTVYTMVVQGNDTKVIENYAGTGPATLWAIEQLIDALLETAEWNAGGNEY